MSTQVTTSEARRSTGTKKPQSTRLRCVELRLQMLGVRAIARRLKINPSAVTRHLQHPESVKAIADATEGVLEQCRKDVDVLAPELIDVATGIATGKRPARRDQVRMLETLLAVLGIAKKVELSGPNGAPIPVAVSLPDMSGLTFGELLQLVQKGRATTGSDNP